MLWEAAGHELQRLRLTLKPTALHCAHPALQKTRPVTRKPRLDRLEQADRAGVGVERCNDIFSLGRQAESP